jgi:hypothetical protein
MLRSFDEDRAWHESWSHALTRIACESRPDTRSAVLGWLRKWTPLADRAARTLLPMFGPEAQGSALVVSSAHTELLRSCGLERSEVPE